MELAHPCPETASLGNRLQANQPGVGHIPWKRSCDTPLVQDDKRFVFFTNLSQEACKAFTIFFSTKGYSFDHQKKHLKIKQAHMRGHEGNEGMA